MSACVVAAQIVMVPMALLVGAKADAWGRKPLFLAGFLILPIRGCLYTLSDDRFWLVGVQLLDGVGRWSAQGCCRGPMPCRASGRGSMSISS